MVGLEAKRPMFDRFLKDSLRGRIFKWCVSCSLTCSAIGLKAIRGPGLVGVVGSLPLNVGKVKELFLERGVLGWPSLKGSAMILAESKSGNISGPSVLMSSVTSVDSAARRSRSLTSMLLCAGLKATKRGRRDLTMSMPVSPNRSAA